LIPLPLRMLSQVSITWIDVYFSQVLLCILAAVSSGACYGLQRRLLLWRRRGWEVVGDRIWKHLGRFSGWMCAGGVAGAAAFAMGMRARSSLFESQVAGITDRLRYQLIASANQHTAALSVLLSVHLFCVIFAMNMLLRRVSDHASHRSPSRPHFYNRKPLTTSQLLQRRPQSRKR
jgi:hypothetical protein